MISFFIGVQVIALLLITLHDWVHLPPLTNIHAFEKKHSLQERIAATIFHGLCVGIPLAITLLHRDQLSCWMLFHRAMFYTFLTIGTIISWWLPYFFGSYSQESKRAFDAYKNTHHFLPAIRDHVIPNTFHVIMHAVIWACCGIAWYELWNAR